MPKIVIKATKFSKTPEANEVFDSRGWKTVFDQTIIPKKKKIVSTYRYGTPIIELNWEEMEYE